MEEKGREKERKGGKRERREKITIRHQLRMNNSIPGRICVLQTNTKHTLELILREARVQFTKIRQG